MRTAKIALLLAVTTILVSLPRAATAHGSLKHVLGTVTEVASDHVVVKTKKGETESIQRDAATKYFRGDEPAKPDDLAVGDRVVVHATSDDPPLAKTIKFAAPKTSR